MTASRGIYIHIPFCVSKCAYCDFYSVSSDTEFVYKYIDALCDEIRETGETYGDKIIDTVYIGGGTPSLLPVALIEKIVRALHDNYLLRLKEFTIEINPSEDCPLGDYRALGVDRLSVGVQSTDDEVLRVAGRRHNAVIALNTLEKARAYFDKLSADLMIGLPRQNLESAIHSVRDVAPFVTHLSEYMLKLSESVPMYRALTAGQISLPDDDSTVDMYESTYDLLMRFGLERYEISNFAIKGYESLHNLKYWHREEYIGLGAAAHSEIDNVRYNNPASINAYIGGERLGRGRAHAENIYRDDQIFERIMLTLRLSEGLNVDELNRDYNIDFDSSYAAQLLKLKPFLIREGSYLKIKPEKLLLESAIVREFM